MAFGKRKKDEEPLVYNSFEELLEILAEERRKSLKRRKRVFIGIGVYITLLVVFAILLSLTHHSTSSIGGLFGSIGGIAVTAYAASQTQRKAVGELANFNDVRMAPPLIETLEYNDKELKLSAAGLLYDLLPRLQASDASLLTSEHYAILNRVLGSKFLLDKQYVSTLILAILKAMEQIGDESSLSIVQELAEGKGKAKKDPEIRRAAEECLPFLQQRAEHQHQTETLLRAADGSITSADVLLRPAAVSTAPVHADQLLRAMPSEPTDFVPALIVPTVSVQEEQRLQTPG